jgi:hypothetical protein
MMKNMIYPRGMENLKVFIRGGSVNVILSLPISIRSFQMPLILLSFTCILNAPFIRRKSLLLIQIDRIPILITFITHIKCICR